MLFTKKEIEQIMLEVWETEVAKRRVIRVEPEQASSNALANSYLSVDTLKRQIETLDASLALIEKQMERFVQKMRCIEGLVKGAVLSARTLGDSLTPVSAANG
jgi:hypothetical protein